MPKDYESYHKRVVECVRNNLSARWPPQSDRERTHLETLTILGELREKRQGSKGTVYPS